MVVFLCTLTLWQQPLNMTYLLYGLFGITPATAQSLDSNPHFLAPLAKLLLDLEKQQRENSSVQTLQRWLAPWGLKVNDLKSQKIEPPPLKRPSRQESQLLLMQLL